MRTTRRLALVIAVPLYALLVAGPALGKGPAAARPDKYRPFYSGDTGNTRYQYQKYALGPKTTVNLYRVSDAKSGQPTFFRKSVAGPAPAGEAGALTQDTRVYKAAQLAERTLSRSWRTPKGFFSVELAGPTNKLSDMKVVGVTHRAPGFAQIATSLQMPAARAPMLERANEAIRATPRTLKAIAPAIEGLLLQQRQPKN